MKNNAWGILHYVTNDFDVAYHTEINFPFYCHFLLQFLSLICRENQTTSIRSQKCNVMDNIVSRKWRIPSSAKWFAVIADFRFSLSLSLSFSLSPFFYFYSLLLPAFTLLLSRKLNRDTTNRATKHDLDIAAKKCQQILFGNSLF